MNKQGELTLREANKQINILVVEELGPRMKQIMEDCYKSSTYKIFSFMLDIQCIDFIYSLIEFYSRRK